MGLFKKQQTTTEQTTLNKNTQQAIEGGEGITVAGVEGSVVVTDSGAVDAIREVAQSSLEVVPVALDFGEGVTSQSIGLARSSIQSAERLAETAQRGADKLGGRALDFGEFALEFAGKEAAAQRTAGAQQTGQIIQATRSEAATLTQNITQTIAVAAAVVAIVFLVSK